MRRVRYLKTYLKLIIRYFSSLRMIYCDFSVILSIAVCNYRYYLHLSTRLMLSFLAYASRFFRFSFFSATKEDRWSDARYKICSNYEQSTVFSSSQRKFSRKNNARKTTSVVRRLINITKLIIAFTIDQAENLLSSRSRKFHTVTRYES